MIRPIDIRLNAAHPELPLVEATTFTGAPSTVLIRGVPKSVGNWSITAVNVSVTYPDNSTTTRAAVESAEDVWVATIPGTATSGRTTAGFRITADGIDENGAAVTGYVLGFADFAVFSFLPVPAPGETYWLLRYFDTMPTAAKKMDVTIIGGVLRYFNGTTWQPFADLTNYYTKTETDEQIDRVAAYYITYNAQGANFPTRAALVNATTYYSGGDERVPTRNDYAVVMADETHGGAEWQYIYAVPEGETTGQWEPQFPIETNDYAALSNKPQINGNTLTGDGSQSGASLGLLDLTGGTMTGLLSTSTILLDGGPITGALENRPLLSGSRLILKNGSDRVYIGLDAIGFSILHGNLRCYFPSASGTLALLSQIGIPAFESTATYAVGAKVVYDNAIWNCTTAVSTAGVWNATNWAKLFDIDTGAPASGGTMLITNGQVHAALQDKVNASALPYAVSESIPLTVASGAASTTLDDRTHNVRTVAAPGSGNTTTITATLPAIVQGKSRDMFLNLTVGTQASDAGDISLSIVEPSGATVQIDIGSVEDIGIGKNEILISENALPTTNGNVTTTHWLVTVRHEDFVS